MKKIGSVTIDDAKLTALTKELMPRAEKIVSKTAMDIEGDAKKTVPVDTGNLKNSIKAIKKAALSWIVEASAEYALYVEFGTRKMRAQPFLLPALERRRAPFLKAWEALIKPNEKRQ